MPDDYTNNTSTSSAVEVGRSTTGEIDYANDRDWFAVDLEGSLQEASAQGNEQTAIRRGRERRSTNNRRGGRVEFRSREGLGCNMENPFSFKGNVLT